MQKLLKLLSGLILVFPGIVLVLVAMLGSYLLGSYRDYRLTMMVLGTFVALSGVIVWLVQGAIVLPQAIKTLFGKYEPNYLHGLMMLALLLHMMLSKLGWDNDLFGAFGEFRQMQTAMSSYWMVAEGHWMPYITPLLGYPWSIPLEFPTYQLLVAFISKLMNLPLVQAGKFVSLLFFYGSMPLVYICIVQVAGNRQAAAAAVCLTLLHPKIGRAHV